MDELVRWLGEQLDEDERIARAAGGPWRELSGNWVAAVDEPASAKPHRVAMVLVADERAHIVRHDPARVLREIDAKRRVLARHCAAPVPPGNEWAEEYPYCAAHAYKGPDGTAVYPVELEKCPELRDLAAPYADRPGYQKGWAP